MGRRTAEANILETQLNKLLNKAEPDKNDLPEIKKILGELVALDDYAEDKNFQFLGATWRNDLLAAQELLSEGVELTDPIIAEHTLLMLTVLLDNSDIVKSVYEYKEKKGKPLFDADQAFLDAVTYNLSDPVAALLTCGVDPNDALLTRPNGDNPLIITIKQQNMPLYQQLIKGGADVDTKHPDMLLSARQYIEKYLEPDTHETYIQIFEENKIAKAEAELAGGNIHEQLVQDLTTLGVEGTVTARETSSSQLMEPRPISRGDDAL